MDSRRIAGLQMLGFAAVAFFILFQAPTFGSREPSTLRIGLVIILLAVWEAARGQATLFFRRVTKADAPTQFWIAVYLTVILGIVCVGTSYL